MKNSAGQDLQRVKRQHSLSKPRNCEIILNYDCNAKCVFCYHPDTVLNDSNRMPYEKAVEALYKGRQDNCWVAYLIGGEITLRDDLPKIVRSAKKLGYLYIQVMSNALKLADPDYTRSLVEAGANIFRISIHGHTAELHDRLVRVPGAFSKVMKAFENVKRSGAEISINHALNRYNYRTVHRLIELISGRFGIEDFNIIFPHYNGMMAAHASELKVSVTQAVPFLRKGLEYLRDAGAKVENAVFINLCPCNMPEAVHLMDEWERPPAGAADEPLFHIDGAQARIHGLKESLCMKNESCRLCVYNPSCMGFEKWYFDIFGGKEFRPVKNKPKPFPLRPSYRKVREAIARLGGVK